MKKILLLFPNASSGGAEKAATRYVSSLTGYKFHVINNDQVVSTSFEPQTNRRFSMFKYILMLMATLRDNKYDIIISFKSHIINIPIIFIILYFSQKQTKIVMRESNDVLGYYSHEISGKFRKLLFKLVIKRVPALLSDIVICNSKRSSENFRSLIGVKSSKIKTIYNPQFVANDVKDQTNPKIFDIAFVGRLEHQKNAQLFLQITKELSTYRNIKAVVVGNGSEEKSLKAWILSMDLSSVVSYRGFTVQAVKESLSTSKILVLTSKYEGMPNVIFEALEAGCNVITYNMNSGPSEILPSRFITDTANVGLLSDKIRELIDGSIQSLSQDELDSIKLKFSESNFITNFGNIVDNA